MGEMFSTEAHIVESSVESDASIRSYAFMLAMEGIQCRLDRIVDSLKFTRGQIQYFTKLENRTIVGATTNFAIQSASANKEEFKQIESSLIDERRTLKYRQKRLVDM